MTEHNNLAFDELSNAVIEQLKEQHYMDSTLLIYKRIYRRIKEFMKQKGIFAYSPESGQAFLELQNVSSSTYSTYACAVRRLNDLYNGKEYRCHHDNPSEEICPEYQELLNNYLTECIDRGNKPRTIIHKKFSCVVFLNALAKKGYKDISVITAEIIGQTLLLFSNKDRYSDIRLLLKYLYENKKIEEDYSGIIPQVKRKIPIPTVYTVDEIKKIENSIDLSTDTGIRNICIIRLASRMGFRSGDIAKLKINEIDFVSNTIKIIQEKTGMPLELEIPYEVSESLYMHLENSKKNHYSDDYVFHSMSAPYTRLTTSIIRHVINDCMKRAETDINGRKHGAHAFRSSLASSMVNDNASYEVVRKILGHADPNVIKHYAKTDIEKLRLCAIEPPEPTGVFNEYLSGKKVFHRV